MTTMQSEHNNYVVDSHTPVVAEGQTTAHSHQLTKSEGKEVDTYPDTTTSVAKAT